MIMSCVGVTSGRPCAGLNTLLADSISTRASAWASADSGRWTAIWSPSKSALKAVQTSGRILDCLALDQHRLKGLNTQTVQGRCTVQQHRMFPDHVVENVPDLWLASLDHALGRLDVLCDLLVDQLLHHEGLEQLECHDLGQPALMELEGRTGHDD